MQLRRAVILVGLAATAGAPQNAAAEYDGQPVVVRLPYNTPLTATLSPSAYLAIDDPAHDVRVSASLRIGSHKLGSIGTRTAHVVQASTAVNFTVPAAIRSQAASLAKSTGVSQATVSFSIEGVDVPSSTSTSTVSLRAPARTAGATPIGIQNGTAGTAAFGHVATISLATPKNLLRTSAAGATIATFTRVPVGGSCTAHITAYSGLLQVGSISSYAMKIRPFNRVRFGRSAASEWQVNAPDSASPVPSMYAIGGRQVAHRRWAFVRVYVTFTPGCPPSVVRQAALLGLVQHAVSRVTTSTHAGRR